MPLSDAMQRLWRDPDLALDMGTSRTRLLGPAATLVVARTASHAVDRGRIVDPDSARRLLARLIRLGHLPGRRRSRVFAACPTNATPESRRLLVGTLMEAGSAEVHTVPSTLAAALGSGADVGGPYAEMVVDLGAGLTEMAVFRNGAAVACAAAEVGTEDGPSMLDRIVDAVRAFWRGLCEDDQVETIESGLVVSGGGALMAPLVARLQEALGLTLRIGPQPEQAVVRGLFRVARSL